MKTLIVEQLGRIEQEKHVKILYACESGSRAWGFPSPDSDYDVRFIYAHPADWYLTLQQKEDTIELPINDALDIGGWELKKALGLLWKSNAPLLEWLQSPIVYHKSEAFLDGIEELGATCFSPVSAMHHYLSMAKKYTDTCTSTPEVKLKHYFYALRTVISANWIRKNKSVPPIELAKMFGILNDNLVRKTEELIRLKATKEEAYLHQRESVIDDFLLRSIEENQQIAALLPAGKGHVQQLDQFFLEWIK